MHRALKEKKKKNIDKKKDIHDYMSRNRMSKCMLARFKTHQQFSSLHSDNPRAIADHVTDLSK